MHRNVVCVVCHESLSCIDTRSTPLTPTTLHLRHDHDHGLQPWHHPHEHVHVAFVEGENKLGGLPSEGTAHGHHDEEE